MAKKKKEATEEVVEKVDNVTKVDLKKTEDDNVIKVDLSKPLTPKEDEKTTEDVTDNGGVVELVEDTDATQEQEKVQSETETQETPVVEEITEEEINEQVEEITVEAEKAITESIETGKELPENVQKLVDFMEETGGDINDYVKLNQDYSGLDNQSLLKEYYKTTKPHLDNEEIDFLMEDSFAYDEDVDDERDIKRKKLALKEQVAGAKDHLDGLKSKYYEDIKSGSKLTGEQQKAIDFFDRYNKESKENEETAKDQLSTFENKTNEVFNDKFKGFEYNIGEKKFRFNVKDTNKVKDQQSNIENFVGKFLDKKNRMLDAKGYHKSLYTAMNADSIANHFYEQGKADALKNSVAKSKNISMDPRQQHSGEINTGGLKFKVLGNDSNDFKFKIKNKQ